MMRHDVPLKTSRQLSVIIALASVLLAGCTEFPSLDERIRPQAAAAPFPALQPLAPLLALASARPQITDANVQASASRIAGLQAKAARLRSADVVDAGTLIQLNAGIDKSGL